MKGWQQMRNTSYNKKSTVSSTIKWETMNWKRMERYVEKLQQRIYRAESQGNKRKVRNLQRLLMNSRAALLISIKRVTQTNKGKRTAGIDGQTALNAKERMQLFQEMSLLNMKYHKPKPSYRTYIRKKNGKFRPLSIPIIKDRVYQNVAKMALEPQWEVRFEATTYGFRPQRSCHDAVMRIYNACSGGKKQWIFEGDFKGCFDNLNQSFILEKIKEFPRKELIKRWLQCGYVENGVYHETEVGSGQGSLISPLLANIALTGMEEQLGIRYKTARCWNRNPSHTNISRYSLVFYADDFVIMCEKKEEAIGVYEKIKPYLQERGLELSEEKTKVSHIQDGFDFLGFTIRRFKCQQGNKLLVRPSKESINKTRRQLSEEVKKLYGSNVEAVVKKLNPIITGKANYWKPMNAKKTFTDIDQHIWNITYRFLKRLHPKKGWRKWISKRYFKEDRTGQSKNKWILTSPTTGSQLKKMSWTGIKRHELVAYKNSPYDNSLKEYYKARKRKLFERETIESRQKLAKMQKYRCPLCGESMLDVEEKLSIKHKIPTNHGGKEEYKNLQLVHQTCKQIYYKNLPKKGKLPEEKEKREIRQVIKRMKLSGMI